MNQLLKSFLIQILRKASYKWIPRTKARNKFRVKVGEFSTGKDKFGYQCNICKNIFMAKETVMDHINPVVPPEGYKSGKDFDLEEYAERMFCDEFNFQCICSMCHDIKTKDENQIRKDKRQSKKIIINKKSTKIPSGNKNS